MTNKKPLVEKGIIIYKDYSLLFNFLNDKELGITIRLLLKNFLNPTLKKDPTNNKNINNVYNYIINRIIDYQKKRDFYVECGKLGGNPTLRVGDKGMDKLKEEKRKEKKKNIKEYKENPPYEKMIEIWNKIFNERVTLNLQTRNKKLNNLIGNKKYKDENGDVLFDSIEDWKKLCEIVKNNPFLMGENKRNWKATIDFVIKDFVKIIEGSYANKQ